MIQPQAPQTQSSTQGSTSNPCDQKPHPCGPGDQQPKEPDPCQDTTPKPKPPPEDPCPPPKACPPPPVKPCPAPEPDPCAPAKQTTETGQEDDGATQRTAATQDSAEASAQGSESGGTLGNHLEQLNEQLKAAQRRQMECAALTTSIADLKGRIDLLQKTVDGQQKTADDYRQFFESMQRERSSLSCYIHTQRCQLKLTDWQKTCIAKAIAKIDGKIGKARTELASGVADVKRKQATLNSITGEADWASKWNEFFKSLQASMKGQYDDAKSIKVDPTKECEAWFYLKEIETIIGSKRSDGDDGQVCYASDITLGTFLDCWAPDCYTAAYEYWLIKSNDLEVARKNAQTAYDNAVKRVTDLTAALAALVKDRRAAIIKEITTAGCCGPLCKCP